MATEKGHLDQERKYLNSTKEKILLNDNFPEQAMEQVNNIFTTIFHPLTDTHIPQ